LQEAFWENCYYYFFHHRHLQTRTNIEMKELIVFTHPTSLISISIKHNLKIQTIVSILSTVKVFFICHIQWLSTPSWRRR
jgi:hypothetical protein